MFKQLWSRKDIQLRVLHFVWRFLNDALTTNARRARVIPGVDGTCPLCNAEPETITHLLLHCPTVKGIWNSPGYHFDIADGEDISLVVERWLNARGENADIFVAGANLMWWVWKYHCKWVFESDLFSVDTVRAMVAAAKTWLVGGHNAIERTRTESFQHAWQPLGPQVNYCYWNIFFGTHR